jgi:hypothetical protein
MSIVREQDVRSWVSGTSGNKTQDAPGLIIFSCRGMFWGAETDRRAKLLQVGRLAGSRGAHPRPESQGRGFYFSLLEAHQLCSSVLVRNRQKFNNGHPIILFYITRYIRRNVICSCCTIMPRRLFGALVNLT